MDIRKSVEYVCDRLIAHGCIIYRYNAKSSNSIYLKVDGGLAFSIRFSDHRGYEHLKYRYNFLSEEPGNTVTSILDTTERYYYQASALDQLIDDVLNAREERRQSLKDYDALISKKVKESKEIKGFWQKAYCVNAFMEKRARNKGKSKGNAA